jgi:hypothetical protein
MDPYQAMGARMRIRRVRRLIRKLRRFRRRVRRLAASMADSTIPLVDAEDSEWWNLVRGAARELGCIVALEAHLSAEAAERRRIYREQAVAWFDAFDQGTGRVGVQQEQATCWAYLETDMQDTYSAAAAVQAEADQRHLRSHHVAFTATPAEAERSAQVQTERAAALPFSPRTQHRDAMTFGNSTLQRATAAAAAAAADPSTRSSRRLASTTPVGDDDQPNLPSPQDETLSPKAKSTSTPQNANGAAVADRDHDQMQQQQPGHGHHTGDGTDGSVVYDDDNEEVDDSTALGLGGLADTGDDDELLGRRIIAILTAKVSAKRQKSHQRRGG